MAVTTAVDAREAGPATSSVQTTTTSTRAGNPNGAFQVAGKIGSAVKGAAVGFRAGRGSDEGQKRDGLTDADAADGEAEKPERSEDQQPPTGGPFKVIIPSQTAPDAVATQPVPVPVDRPIPTQTLPVEKQTAAPVTPAQAAPAASPRSDATPAAQAKSSGPVRTIAERDRAGAVSAPKAAQPTTVRASTPTAESAVPASSAVAVTAKPALEPAAATVETGPVAAASNEGVSCVAGCLDGRTTGAAARREKRDQRPAAAPPASATGFECIAGCDGTQARRAKSSELRPTAAEGNGRVTVLRGVTRSRVYGVSN